MDDKVKLSLRILETAIDNFPKIAVACSYGKDSIVLVDLCRRIKPDIQVFSVITRFKPPETVLLKKYVDDLWDLNVKTYRNDEPIPENLHKTDPDLCCELLKVQPTRQAIEELKLNAWIAGLRKDEGKTRHNYDYFETYDCGLVKVNPILDWSESDIWRYTAVRALPVNPLYEQGYRSLGCACCSAPNTDEERGGRWVGTSKSGGECGIHTVMYKRV